MKWLTITFCAFAALNAAAATLDDAVAAGYPAVLSQTAAQHHYTNDRQQAYVVAGNAVVAAYSNGHVGGVALLTLNGNGATLQQTIRDHQTGKNPDVSVVDLDADGQPEFVVRFDLGPRGGSQTWIYSLRGGRLTLISPTDSRGNSLLGYPDIIDVDGSGRMEIVDAENDGDSREEPVIVERHWVLANGAFQERAALDFYKTFFREKGSPVTNTETFSIEAASVGKPYRLTVINGGELGADARSSSGTITLNGVTVSGPSDFNPQRGSWTIPVTLQADNTITVRLDGKPGSRIVIAIRHD